MFTVGQFSMAANISDMGHTVTTQKQYFMLAVLHIVSSIAFLHH